MAATVACASAVLVYVFEHRHPEIPSDFLQLRFDAPDFRTYADQTERLSE